MVAEEEQQKNRRVAARKQAAERARAAAHTKPRRRKGKSSGGKRGSGGSDGDDGPVMSPVKDKAAQAAERAAARDKASRESRQRFRKRQPATEADAGGGEETVLDAAMGGTTQILLEAQQQLQEFTEGDAAPASSKPTTPAEARFMSELSARVDRIAAGGSPTREDSPSSLSAKLAALTQARVSGFTPPGSRSPSPHTRGSS